MPRALSEKAHTLPPEEAVRQYKNLARVEEVFRTMKSTDMLIRPIRHRLDRRVRAHILICMLAYYVNWHMKSALAPILFHNEDIEGERSQRDPVAKAMPSATARREKQTKSGKDGTPLRSFRTLLAGLSTRCRNRCATKVHKISPSWRGHISVSPPGRAGQVGTNHLSRAFYPAISYCSIGVLTRVWSAGPLRRL